MRRRMLLCLSLTVLGACRGDDATKPITSRSLPPSRMISDGSHNSGNPDFFFLPPLVSDPQRSSNANWDAGAFDGTRTATVRICELTATDVTDVALAHCSAAAGAYSDAFTATVNQADESYQVNWKVPVASTTKFYRVSVYVLTNRLGSADVEALPNSVKIKNANTLEDVPLLNDGRTLPLKFRIEAGALERAVVTVNLGDGGEVSTTFPGQELPSGIIIPPQPDRAGTVATVTVQPCAGGDLNPRVTDLKTFGNCINVTSDPAFDPEHPLTNPAVVFDCGVDADVEAHSLTITQERRVTLHRFDDDVPGGRLAALPHAPACGTPPVTSSTTPTLKGALAGLAHGQIRAAARQLAELLSPKPAYAAMFIDLGGGGFSAELSDFQFALPAKMEAVPGVNGNSAIAGTVLLPAVQVTDLGGEPVAGAVVHFFTATPSASGDVTVTTGTNGLASTPWTIAAGTNVLPVSGRGIASPATNGPRRTALATALDDINDPFQPIQPPFDPTFAGIVQEVPVLTGALTFTVASTTVSATASVSPTSYTGTCPALFTFTGIITSTTAGTVSYTWDRSDGATGPVTTLTFAGPGSQTVTATWTIGVDGFSGWERVHIITPSAIPNPVVSNMANFTLTCTAPPA